MLIKLKARGQLVLINPDHIVWAERGASNGSVIYLLENRTKQVDDSLEDILEKMELLGVTINSQMKDPKGG